LISNWKPWLYALITALAAIGIWFVAWEGVALFNGTPGDTLTAKFMEASCIGKTSCSNPNAGLVKWSTLALLTGLLSLSGWLIWHFYFEPVRYLKKHGKEIERS
jgi:hypothetical protein